MRRYRIEHDRDSATKPGFHWNLFESDLPDPAKDEDRVFIGYGSWETCLRHAVGLIELRERTGLK